jgi:error-prone DNA polymerase
MRPFHLPHGRGDQVTHADGGPDPRELPPKGLRTRDIYIPDLHIDTIKVKSRNFLNGNAGACETKRALMEAT